MDDNVPAYHWDDGTGWADAFGSTQTVHYDSFAAAVASREAVGSWNFDFDRGSLYNAS
jgi:hypothetical protein